MTGKRGLRPFVALLGLFSLACGAEHGKIDAAATDGRSDLEIAEVQPPQAVADAEDPFGVFALESATNDAAATNSITPVWMINQSGQPVVVSGHGGAASVVLDTIGGVDSVLVRIETRARTVVLEALGPGSMSLGTVAVPMDSQPKRIAFPQ